MSRASCDERVRQLAQCIDVKEPQEAFFWTSDRLFNNDSSLLLGSPTNMLTQAGLVAIVNALSQTKATKPAEVQAVIITKSYDKACYCYRRAKKLGLPYSITANVAEEEPDEPVQPANILIGTPLAIDNILALNTIDLSRARYTMIDEIDAIQDDPLQSTAFQNIKFSQDPGTAAIIVAKGLTGEQIDTLFLIVQKLDLLYAFDSFYYELIYASSMERPKPDEEIMVLGDRPIESIEPQEFVTLVVHSNPRLSTQELINRLHAFPNATHTVIDHEGTALNWLKQVCKRANTKLIQ